jgi:CDP-glucose 4,6-dehydratase
MVINGINPNFWSGKKVFVTGHTGFKGSWLCIFLKILGAKVTGYALQPKTNPSLFKLAKIEEILEKSIYADIRDYERLIKEIKKSKANIIFHLAAQPLVRYSYIKPKETFETNILGTLNILESVRKIKKIKSTVIITSDKVYDTAKIKIFKETDILGGYDPYSSSKVSCEHLFSSYIHSFFKNKSYQKLATVRAGNVIGGGDYSEDRLIPDILLSAKKVKKIVLRNPNAVRPWQHVLEPLNGYLILAEKLYKNEKKIRNIKQNWNFGPNISNCKSVKYIAKFFAKNLKLKIKVLRTKGKIFTPETSFLRLGNFKAKKFLNWHPKWSLEKSLNKILDWYYLTEFQNARNVCENQIKEFIKKINGRRRT